MSINLQIEHGIPIPTATVRQGGNVTLLKQMSVGDSIYFEPKIAKKATRFYRVAKKLGYKIVIRRDEQGGMRLWRVTGEGLVSVPPTQDPPKKLTKVEQKRARDKAYKARKKQEKLDLGRNL
jgi:hypothetical protein